MFTRRGLRDQLNDTEALLVRLCTSVHMPSESTPSMGNSDRYRIEDAKSRIVNNLLSLQQDVAKFQRDLAPEEACRRDDWTLLSQYKQRCQALARDMFDLERTVALRTTPRLTIPADVVDDLQLCEAADVLIEEAMRDLGEPRSSFVLISEAEHFQAASSSVHLGWTRLRFWHLNRTLHETAHLWAEEFANGPSGVQRAFVERVADVWEEVVAKELFADALATYHAGPAYGYACLFHDFDPSDRKISTTHPVGDVRARCVLMMLDCLLKTFEGEAKLRLKQTVDRLWKFWQHSRSSAGVIDPFSNAALLRDGLERLATQLERKVPKAKYSNLAGAYAVKLHLQGLKKYSALGITGIDVLNGAWLCHLESQDSNDDKLATAAARMMANLRGRT